MPHSLYLTIRKSFSNVSQKPVRIQPTVEFLNIVSKSLLKEEIKLNEATDMNHRLQIEHKEVVSDGEEY
jgi:hypothetical protein